MNLISYLIFSLYAVVAAAQSDSLPVFPRGDFSSPVDIPILLAGNFGEPRRSHFHTGIDIRTLEREGLPIHSIADGYISRIGVSPYGYGNVLYITHSNGYTSVYAHLQSFNSRTSSLLHDSMYARQRNAIDLYLPPAAIPVKRGELVALSGNTGGSGGPHLHFEIRDILERPINPLNFGFTSSDHVAPIIGGLKLYALDEQRYTAEGIRPPTKLVGKVYTTNSPLLKVNSSTIGIAINTWDKMDGGVHSLGIYQIRLYDDDNLSYQYRVDRLDFEYSRFIIAQVDYPIFLREGSRSYHRCYQMPNNTLPTVYRSRDRGQIDLSNGLVHHLRIEVSDYNGNVATLNTQVQYDELSKAFVAKPIKYQTILSPVADNHYEVEGFKVSIPARTILDTMYVAYQATVSFTPSTFSIIHKLGTGYEHLLGYYDIAIAPVGLPDALHDKALIVWRGETGGPAAKGGKWQDGMLTARVRELGTFYINIDTTAPRVVPINISKGRKMTGIKNIYLNISDQLSGLAEYWAHVDGKWTLLDLEGKSGLVTVPIPSALASGTHTFKFTATDERKNTTIYEVGFEY